MDDILYLKDIRDQCHDILIEVEKLTYDEFAS